jgi:hypothetical protein
MYYLSNISVSITFISHLGDNFFKPIFYIGFEVKIPLLPGFPKKYLRDNFLRVVQE